MHYLVLWYLYLLTWLQTDFGLVGGECSHEKKLESTSHQSFTKDPQYGCSLYHSQRHRNQHGERWYFLFFSVMQTFAVILQFEKMSSTVLYMLLFQRKKWHQETLWMDTGRRHCTCCGQLSSSIKYCFAFFSKFLIN